MPVFKVAWMIDVEAHSYEEAALKAYKIHRDPEEDIIYVVVTPDKGSVLVDIDDLPRCSACKEPVNPSTLKRYRNEILGEECCWDEKLASKN